MSSPQTRLALARRRPGAPGNPPHLAPADLERARRTHREQLRRAVVALALLAVLIVGMPLTFAAYPWLDQVRLLGVPVSWLAIGVLPYPLLALLARWQLRAAERIERSGGAG